ncbi:MAG: ribonuclease HII [Promethearchaeota archaeon]
MLGADEAGRGPVLGPLVICAACFNEVDIDFLKEHGVQDSKKLTSAKREEMLVLIKHKVIEYEVKIFTAKEIDDSLRGGVNLNQLEVKGFIQCINAILVRGTIPDKVWLDAADIDADRFKNRIKNKLIKDVEVIAMHKCDEKITCVGAASIIAKTTRDGIIEDLKEEFGKIGSGYPSDGRTRDFIKEYYLTYGKFPPFARMTWGTMDKLKKELGLLPKGQKKLGDWF